MKPVVSLAILILLGSTPGADAEHGDTTRPIADGTYHCKAGGSRTMLTLGDMTIAGTFNGYERQTR